MVTYFSLDLNRLSFFLHFGEIQSEYERSSRQLVHSKTNHAKVRQSGNIERVENSNEITD